MNRSHRRASIVTVAALSVMTLAACSDANDEAKEVEREPVSYTHLRAHETYEGISCAVVCL